jgi:hypothetical protein
MSRDGSADIRNGSRLVFGHGGNYFFRSRACDGPYDKSQCGNVYDTQYDLGSHASFIISAT